MVMPPATRGLTAYAAELAVHVVRLDPCKDPAGLMMSLLRRLSSFERVV